MPRHIDAISPLTSVLTRLRKINPVERVAVATDIYEQLAEVQRMVVSEKRSAVREMREDGMTLDAIAKRLGISVSRVKQLEDGPQADTPQRKLARLQRKLDKAQAEADAS